MCASASVKHGNNSDRYRARVEEIWAVWSAGKQFEIELSNRFLVRYLYGCINGKAEKMCLNDERN